MTLLDGVAHLRADDGWAVAWLAKAEAQMSDGKADTLLSTRLQSHQ
jgi:hypothetical protein